MNCTNNKLDKYDMVPSMQDSINSVVNGLE